MKRLIYLIVAFLVAAATKGQVPNGDLRSQFGDFKIVSKTKDSLYFDNGGSVAKHDLHKLNLYWRFVQDRENQLRSQGKTDYYKDQLWKKYWDSSSYYYNRLPDFIRFSHHDIRKYKDSL